MKGGSNGRDDGPPAGDELKLLSTLLATPDNSQETSKQIMLSMFDDDEGPKSSSTKHTSSIATGKVKINKTSKALDSAMQEVCFLKILFMENVTTITHENPGFASPVIHNKDPEDFATIIIDDKDPRNASFLFRTFCHNFPALLFADVAFGPR